MTVLDVGLLRRSRLTFGVPDVSGRSILVTGSSGTIGSAVCAVLANAGANVDGFDQAAGSEQDVCDATQFERWTQRHSTVDAIIHLAAHKRATDGEATPARVAEVNVLGTANARAAAEAMGADLIIASTCKAADPCTAYGASKLIAEREALRYDRTRVLRLVNVLGSSGSVLEIWNQLSPVAPLPVALHAKRMWLELAEAVEALLALLTVPHGLYAPLVPPPEHVHRLAERAYPQRRMELVPLRRGDRAVERLVGEYETATPVKGQDLIRIVGPWGDA